MSWTWMGEMFVCTKWLMGVLFFIVVCFPIHQFNEILKDQADNPQQQQRNPWFVMSSMLYCKQTQAAYQGSKDLLSYARSLPCKMEKEDFPSTGRAHFETGLWWQSSISTQVKPALICTEQQQNYGALHTNREVTVTAWDWILLKTISLFPNWPLGELFIAEKRLFNQSAHHRLFSEAVVSLRVYFWSVDGSARIGRGNMI